MTDGASRSRKVRDEAICALGLGFGTGFGALAMWFSPRAGLYAVITAMALMVFRVVLYYRHGESDRTELS